MIRAASRPTSEGLIFVDDAELLKGKYLRDRLFIKDGKAFLLIGFPSLGYIRRIIRCLTRSACHHLVEHCREERILIGGNSYIAYNWWKTKAFWAMFFFFDNFLFFFDNSIFIEKR